MLLCPTLPSYPLIRLSSPVPQNFSLSSLIETSLHPAPSRPSEGRIAIVTDAGWDAVDAAASGAQR
jgi:hypothetical protein